ncbi:MAG: hypothetical protein DRI39_01980 [Chloroflexi bacterium]|nr:MAG: hypothetical protein DRI39_01980 [Chloroflexota bacterium]
MPIYEYRCNNCHCKVSLLVKGFAEAPQAACTRCGSKDLTRLFSTFARLKTDQDVYEDILGDTDLVNRMMANDPKALAEWSRRLEGSEATKDSEYAETMERLERGESWQSIVSDMQAREFGTAGDDSSEED